MFFVDDLDEQLTREQGSDRLVGMFPYMVVYPGFSEGDYSVGKGHIPLHDGESLGDYVRVRLGTELGEYLEVDRPKEIARAFRARDRKILERYWAGPFSVVLQNRRPGLWRKIRWHRRGKRKRT